MSLKHVTAVVCSVQCLVLVNDRYRYIIIIVINIVGHKYIPLL